MDMAVLDLREKLDALVLPKEAVRPIVLRFDPSQDPIVRLGLSLKPPAAEGAKPGEAAPATALIASESDLKRLRRIAEEQVQKMLKACRASPPSRFPAASRTKCRCWSTCRACRSSA